MMMMAKDTTDNIAKIMITGPPVSRISRAPVMLLYQRCRSAADQIDDLKSYSSMVAHDIKNPVGLMQGFANQLYENWEYYSDDGADAKGETANGTPGDENGKESWREKG